MQRRKATGPSAPPRAIGDHVVGSGAHCPLTRRRCGALVRYALVAGPILMPLGFFLSVASAQAQQPNRLIYLVPLGGLSVSIGAVTLGIGLIGA